MAQPAKHFFQKHEDMSLILRINHGGKLDMVAKACNPRSREMKTEAFPLARWSASLNEWEFQVTERPYLKKHDRWLLQG